MKKFKITWILMGVLLLLAAVVYWVDIKEGEKRKEKQEQKEKLFVFEKSKVQSVMLTNEHGIFVANRTGEASWQLNKPLSASADKEIWESIVDTVFEFKPSRVISERGADLTPYGLNAPQLQVKLMISGPSGESTGEPSGEPSGEFILKVGDENPVGDSLFMTDQASQKVVLGSKALRYTLNKTLKQLREKKLFQFEMEGTQEITIQDAKKRLVLKKEGNDWFIVSTQQKKPAQASKVMMLLQSLQTLQVTEFEDEAPKDLAKYGLTKPTLMVAVRNEKTTQLELLFGKTLNNSVYLAKKAEKPVYQVNATVMNQLSADSQTYLKKENPITETQENP